MADDSSHVGGDRGAGDREKRGLEVYGRREKRGREAGFPRWREAGEKGKNYATLRNISQSKKCKGAGAKKYRAGTGIKGYGKREVQTPLSPPPPVIACTCTESGKSEITCNQHLLLHWKGEGKRLSFLLLIHDAFPT